MSARETGRSGQKPHQHPVEAVFLRAARAAGRADHRLPTQAADQHQVAGIDRHAEMLDFAADGLDRRRDDVAAVGDGRGAEHDHQFGARFKHLVDGARERRRLVRHAPLGNDGRASGRNARCGDLEGLLNDFRRQSGQQSRNNADLAHSIGRDANDRLGLCGFRHRLVARTAGDRERNDLHSGDHFAFHHRLECRQRGNRHRLVDTVEPVDRVLVEHQHAGRFREQIAAAGEGAVGAHALAFHGRCDVRGRLILRHVARLEPRHHDVLDAGRLQSGDFRRPDQRALLEHEIALADRMHRGSAERVAWGDRAELHAASAFSDFMRSRCVISAMIATAISAGVTAPIAKPIGA